MANKKFLNPINLVNLASDPSTANDGDIYYNTTADAVKVYANGVWVVIGAGGTGDGSDITVSTTAPSSPVTGDAWYKNNTGEFYVYDGSFWVEVNGVIESNGFTTIAVSGQSNVVADSTGDILTLVAGTNVGITTDATTDSITINSTGNYTSVDSITYPDYITFDTTPETEPTAVGSIWWNPDAETLNVQLDSAVTLQVGQEHVVRVKNDSASVAIPEMRAVMFAGATGDTVEVTPALSTASYEPELLVGVTTEQISADGFGFVTQFGFINKVDTSTPGWSLGDLLYVDPANAGLLTNVKPSAPNWTFPVAAVTRVHASTGRILVRALPGKHLHDVVDVAIDSPADNEVLAYDTTSGVWKNQTASEAGLAALAGAVFTGNIELDVSRKLVFDGTTDEAYKTTLYIVDPTNDREILLPDAAGTIALTADLSAYLTTSTASSTYAPIASPTFTGTVTIPSGASIDGYLTTSSASSTYLTQTNASSTYQPLDTELTALAGTTSAADTLPYFTGSGTASLATLTSYARSLIDDADASTARGTLGLGTMATETASNYLTTASASTTYAALSGATFTGGISGTSLTLSGDLTINGTTTTINSTTLTVDDKNIELGSVTTPTDTTADGGGITLKGTTDKTFNWVNSTSSWTSSEHISLGIGKSLLLNGETSGTITITPTAISGTNTITIPAATGTLALTANKLSNFASTTSAELASVISDETGTGLIVFNDSPTFTGTVTIPNISIGGQALIQASTGTTSATSTFNTTVYSSAEFIVYASTASGNYVSKVLMLARGTEEPVITEYAILTQGTAPTVTITPSYSAPNAVLTVAVTSGTNIEIVKTAISI